VPPTAHPLHADVAIAPAQRWLRASGVAIPVLFLLSGALAPNPPAHGGTDAGLLAFYRGHHDGILAGVFVAALAMLALLVFAAAVVDAATEARHPAGRPAAGLAYVPVLAAAAAGMMLASQATTGATAVVGTHASDAAVVRGLDEIAHMLAHLAMLPLGALVLAMGLVLAGAGAGARSVALAGAVAGGALTLTSSWVFVGGAALHNAGVLALFAVLLWCVVQSVVLARGGRRRPRVGAALTAPLAATPA
jgi:hypothetical protein